MYSRRQNREADFCSSRTPSLQFVRSVLRAVSCREELSNLLEVHGLFVAGSQPHPPDREMRTLELTSRAAGKRRMFLDCQTFSLLGRPQTQILTSVIDSYLSHKLFYLGNEEPWCKATLLSQKAWACKSIGIMATARYLGQAPGHSESTSGLAPVLRRQHGPSKYNDIKNKCQKTRRTI